MATLLSPNFLTGADMSIAVSAVVRRSGLLRVALLAMGLFCLCIGMAIGLGMVGTSTMLARSLLGACCMVGAAAALHEIFRPHVDWRIDISGSGQIHMTSLPARCDSHADPHAGVGDRCAVHCFLPTSTLWSFLMILNLRSAEGTRLTLLLLPDTMTQASFRALCVACHWIAAHNIRAQAENS